VFRKSRYVFVHFRNYQLLKADNAAEIIGYLMVLKLTQNFRTHEEVKFMFSASFIKIPENLITE
jgi:hypothetical protein